MDGEKISMIVSIFPVSNDKKLVGVVSRCGSERATDGIGYSKAYERYELSQYWYTRLNITKSTT